MRDLRISEGLEGYEKHSKGLGLRVEQLYPRSPHSEVIAAQKSVPQTTGGFLHLERSLLSGVLLKEATSTMRQHRVLEGTSAVRTVSHVKRNPEVAQ